MSQIKVSDMKCLVIFDKRRKPEDWTKTIPMFQVWFLAQVELRLI